MINIKELSIGNYVLHLGAAKKVGEIISFTEIVLFQEKYYGLYSNRVSINEIEPVPLTPEILEKNGFRYNDMPLIQGWEQFGLTLYHGGNGYLINCGQNIAMKINAVHQLQNALTLCGISKEIKL